MGCDSHISTIFNNQRQSQHQKIYVLQHRKNKHFSTAGSPSCWRNRRKSGHQANPPGFRQPLGQKDSKSKKGQLRDVPKPPCCLIIWGFIWALYYPIYYDILAYHKPWIHVLGNAVHHFSWGVRQFFNSSIRMYPASPVWNLPGRDKTRNQFQQQIPSGKLT